MRQFDIVENLNPITRRRYPFAVVLQHDQFQHLPLVTVAPLTLATTVLASSRLHPALVLNDRLFVMVAEELAAVVRSSVGRVVGTAEASRYEIVAALDLLFTGV
ncbi:MAG: CcdB family protein [Pseudorhodoplanes sp.]